MKKIKLFSILFALVVFTACDKDDENINNVYDETTDQVGLGFTTVEVLTSCGWNSGTSTGVKTSGATFRIGIESTAKTNEDRSFDFTVNTDLSTGNTGHYANTVLGDGSIVAGTAVIPAGSYTALTNIEFIDDGTLVDGVSYKLALEIALPEGFTSHTSSSITLSYNKYQLCNDYTLTMNEVDGWGSERTWKVTNSGGVVVASGGPYADGAQVFTANMTLQDGLHTLTMYDSFGDGNSNGNEDQEGNFSLDCGITNAAYEKGDWGSEISKDFCVNP
jgi:YbbR domain-containing protein